MEILGLLCATAGAFYAGYQRGRRCQSIADYRARSALVAIVYKLGDEPLSSLGRNIKNTALDGLK